MSKITLKPFSKDDTNFFKGFAILLIVLHNFFRLINPGTGENEFMFSNTFYQKFIIIITSSPLEFIHASFSFLGHYGVQAFIFISAYGLTLSYIDKKPTYGNFLLHRLDRLYPSFFLAAIMLIIITIFTTGHFVEFSLTELGIQLSLFAFSDNYIIVGPWWFYSLIFQFYIVFPLFLWVIQKFNAKGFLLLALTGFVATILLYFPLQRKEINILFFFIGHMPEFCFGIYFALKKEIRIPLWLIFIALICLIGGNIYSWLWPFTNISVTILLVSGIQLLLRYKTKINVISTVLIFIGSISMYLFACHGFLRYNFKILANTFSSPMATYSLAILFIIIAIAISYSFMYGEKIARKWITQPKKKSLKVVRLLLLIIILLLPIGILYAKNNSIINEKKNSKSAVAFSVKNDFENDTISANYSDSIYYSNYRSLRLPPIESYSPILEANFNKINLTGINEIEVSAMFYTTDLLAEGFIVLEVHHLKTGMLMEYKTKFIPKDEFPKNKWELIKFNYDIPSIFKNPDYIIKVFIWNKSKGSFYCDDLKLEIKSRKKM